MDYVATRTIVKSIWRIYECGAGRTRYTLSQQGFLRLVDQEPRGLGAHDLTGGQGRLLRRRRSWTVYKADRQEKYKILPQHLFNPRLKEHRQLLRVYVKLATLGSLSFSNPGSLDPGAEPHGLCRIERHHAQRLVILAGQQVSDDGGEVAVGFVRLAPRRALTELLQHQVDIPIQPIGRDDRWRLTHRNSMDPSPR